MDDFSTIHHPSNVGLFAHIQRRTPSSPAWSLLLFHRKVGKTFSKSLLYNHMRYESYPRETLSLHAEVALSCFLLVAHVEGGSEGLSQTLRWCARTPCTLAIHGSFGHSLLVDGSFPPRPPRMYESLQIMASTTCQLRGNSFRIEKPDQRPHIFWPNLQHLSTDLTNQMIERDDPSQNPKRSLIEVAHPGLMSCEWQSGPLVWRIRIGGSIPIHQETLLKVHFR